MQKACHKDNSERGKSQIKMKIKELKGAAATSRQMFQMCADNEVLRVFSLGLALI